MPCQRSKRRARKVALGPKARADFPASRGSNPNPVRGGPHRDFEVARVFELAAARGGVWRPQADEAPGVVVAQRRWEALGVIPHHAAAAVHERNLGQVHGLRGDVHLACAAAITSTLRRLWLEQCTGVCREVSRAHPPARSEQPTLRPTGTLQGVLPSCRGRRAAVWSCPFGIVCTRPAPAACSRGIYERVIWIVWCPAA